MNSGSNVLVGSASVDHNFECVRLACLGSCANVGQRLVKIIKTANALSFSTRCGACFAGRFSDVRIDSIDIDLPIAISHSGVCQNRGILE